MSHESKIRGSITIHAALKLHDFLRNCYYILKARKNGTLSIWSTSSQSMEGIYTIYDDNDFYVRHFFGHVINIWVNVLTKFHEQFKLQRKYITNITYANLWLAGLYYYIICNSICTMMHSRHTYMYPDIMSHYNTKVCLRLRVLLKASAHSFKQFTSRLLR